MRDLSWVEDLGTLWKAADGVFAAFGEGEMDWDEAYCAFLPRALEVQSPREGHLLLAEFLNLLGDGHTDYSLPMAYRRERGFLPFYPRWREGSWYIVASAPAWKAYRGAKILRLNGEKWEQVLQKLHPYVYHVGAHIYAARITQFLPLFMEKTGNVLETDKGEIAFDLLDSFPALEPAAAPACSVPGQKLEGGRVPMTLYAGNRLYICWEDCQYEGAAAEMAKAIETCRPAGVVLDMRQNMGGMTMNGGKVAELFIDGEFHGSKKRTRSMRGLDLASASQSAGLTREQEEAYIQKGWYTREELERERALREKRNWEWYEDSFGAKGHKALFDGPLAVLISRNTISAAEDVVAMFKSNGRGTLIGEPTCGTTGTPMLLQLRSGGSARICSVRYTLLDGTPFHGRGIEPHISLAGNCWEQDTVLEAGLSAVAPLAPQAQ